MHTRFFLFFFFVFFLVCLLLFFFFFFFFPNYCIKTVPHAINSVHLPAKKAVY